MFFNSNWLNALKFDQAPCMFAHPFMNAMWHQSLSANGMLIRIDNGVDSLFFVHLLTKIEQGYEAILFFTPSHLRWPQLVS